MTDTTMTPESATTPAPPAASDNVAPPTPETARTSLVPHAAVLVVAAAFFTVVARAVATKRAKPMDDRVRAWMHEHRDPVIDVAVKPVTLLSLPVLVVSATAALAWWLKREGRGHAAIAVALAPILASTAGQSFTTFLPQQSPPDSECKPNPGGMEACFPSGHVTGVLAEALTIGYVMSREGIGSSSTVTALALWPLVVGVTRVYRDRHWTSDVIGALFAGTAVAALTTMSYELLKRRENGGASTASTVPAANPETTEPPR